MLIGECCQIFRGMLSKFPGMLSNIPWNAIKDSGECSRRFQGMFGKILENAQKDSTEYFQLYINQSYVLPKKANDKLFLEALAIFAISNETTERSNHGTITRIIIIYHY